LELYSSFSIVHVLCLFCFVLYNFLLLFVLLSFSVHVGLRLICAIKHLLT